MNSSKWLSRIALVVLVGSTLAGCCVAPIGRGYYGGEVVVRPGPVVVAPRPYYGYGWHRW